MDTGRRNEFADAIEKDEPELAKFYRRHGKQAVLYDDEVDMIERGVATMDDMYGRLEAKPGEGNKLTAEDMDAMRAAEREGKRPPGESISIFDANQDESLGRVESPGELQWRQAEGEVQVLVRMDDLGAEHGKSHVEITRENLRIIDANGNVALDCAPYDEVEPEESTWWVHKEGASRVMEVRLGKVWRRGRYKQGQTNAETFWRSLWRASDAPSLLPAKPPTNYYFSGLEID